MILVMIVMVIVIVIVIPIVIVNSNRNSPDTPATPRAAAPRPMGAAPARSDAARLTNEMGAPDPSQSPR